MPSSNTEPTYVCLADDKCYITPGSVIDSNSRIDVCNSQRKLSRVLNSLCLFNESQTRRQLEILLFSSESDGFEESGSGVDRPPANDVLNPPVERSSFGHVQAPSSRPITLLIWDRPSVDDLKRPLFRGSTDVIRTLSCRAPADHAELPSWIADLVMKSFLEIRCFDAHIKVCNVSFFCTAFQASVCMHLKAGNTLRKTQRHLSTFITEGLELQWRKQGDLFYLAAPGLIAKITGGHITECLQSTSLLHAISPNSRLLADLRARILKRKEGRGGWRAKGKMIRKNCGPNTLQTCELRFSEKQPNIGARGALALYERDVELSLVFERSFIKL
ncbi:hypothetical protein SISNIDRAFT_469316 [Sistotremastrum niveocremeum HHB9708]|uniref:Uncharacterized protein n=1 Tax=Sistotremastrum niveocremeum HHB9708 TaxID=1314777 RepID=A0A164QDF8_9AGAM|nr:hypothetical protein SISNIDRAFT_469316 [Sistotremastrum niveocremeum HHB9708]